MSAGANAGDTVTIWVDGDGKQTSAPLSSDQAIAGTVLAMLGFWVVLVIVLAGIYTLLRVRLDHDRYAAWEREWRELDEHRT